MNYVDMCFRYWGVLITIVLVFVSLFVALRPRREVKRGKVKMSDWVYFTRKDSIDAMNEYKQRLNCVSTTIINGDVYYNKTLV